jgi:isoprenylcysteine carboxyl methyltransferase (ICMT) family protein YpbQ
MESGSRCDEYGKGVDDVLRVAHVNSFMTCVCVRVVIVELPCIILSMVRVQVLVAENKLYIALKYTGMSRPRHSIVCLNMLDRHNSVTFADERFHHPRYKLSCIILELPILFA